jgi:hypothetical protein
MKPPSRKHYEKTKPTYKELEDRLEVARLNLISAQTYERELKELVKKLQTVSDWFDVLKRSEVMVVTPEGMKYLVGQDLEDFCRADLEKQMEQRAKVWWSDPLLPSSFAQHAKDHLSKILRDEVDKATLHQYQLDAYKYITKGRYK